MQIDVSRPELEKFIAEQVSAGRFASASEVVEAALARLMAGEAAEDEELDDETYAQLVRANEQIDRGEGYSVEEMRVHFRRQAHNR
jgi:putative addiction module CopG family antidote